MRFLLALPPPLLLILLSIVISVGSPIADQQESWLKARRFLRSASDAEDGVASPTVVADFSSEELKKQFENGEKELEKLQGDINTAKGKVAEQEGLTAAAKKNYNEKKEIFDKLNEKKEAKDKAEQAEIDYKEAENQLEIAKNASIDAEAALKATQDAKVNLPTTKEKKKTIDAEIRQLEKDLPGLKQVANKANNTLGEIEKFIADNTPKVNACTSNCDTAKKTLAREVAKLTDAKANFTRDESTWSTAVARLEVCKETQVKLNKEIVAAALDENDLQQAANTAKEDEKAADADLKTKKDARDAAVAAVPTEDVDPVKLQEANYELIFAKGEKDDMQTAEDELKNNLEALEKSFKDKQEKVDALKDAYAKKTAEQPKKGSLTGILCGVFAGLIGLLILALLLAKFVIVPKLRKKRERKPVASNKDSGAPSGGDASNVASQTPSASQVQPPPAAVQPPAATAPAPAQEPAKSEPAAAAPAKDDADTYLKATPGNPIKAEAMTDDEAKKLIIKASNPTTLVYSVTLAATKAQAKIKTYIFNAEDKYGNCKRLLENGCIGFCLDANKFNFVCAEKITGLEKEFQVKITNPNPDEPLFSAECCLFLTVQEEDRLTPKEHKQLRVDTTESMHGNMDEKREIAEKYRRAIAAYNAKKAKRQVAGRSVAEDTTSITEVARNGLDRSTVVWLKKFLDVKRDQKELNYYEGKQNSTRSQQELERFRKLLEILAQQINRMNIEQQRKFFKDHGTWLQLYRVTVTGYWSQLTSLSAQVRIMWSLEWPYGKEAEQPECLITGGVQPITASDEAPQCPANRCEEILCEERQDNNEGDASRATSGADDAPSDKERERSDKSDKDKDKDERGKKDKENGNKKGSDKSDRNNSDGSLGKEPEPPGHEYPGSTVGGKPEQTRIFLQGNAKPPPIKRLTHDADNKPRADLSHEEMVQMCNQLIDGYEPKKKRDKRMKPILTKDQILAIINQYKKKVEQEPKLIELNRRDVHAIGDVHGSMDVLKRALAVMGPIGSEHFKNNHAVILGDFVDRGTRSIETGMLAMLLHLAFPQQITVLRGNHESYEVNQHYGFKRECINRLGKKDGVEVHFFFNYAFGFMPVSCLADRTFMVHGGIPHVKLKSLQQINEEIPNFLWDPAKHPLACGLLWNDPAFNLKGFKANSRGVGFLFGEDEVLKFCAKHNVKLIIRAHQVVSNGFEFFAGQKMVTIFTCSTYDPDAPFPNRGAICRVSANYVVSFIILVPAERIPSDLPDKQKNMVRQMAVNAHNMMNFMTNVKDGSLLNDKNKAKDPKEGDASETETGY